MKPRTLAMLLLLCACDDDDISKEVIDSGVGDAHTDATIDAHTDATIDAQTAQPNPLFAESLRKWQQLASQNPGAYWYEEENCLVNSQSGSSSIVQVDAQGARLVGYRSFPREECIARVNRYGRIEATFPELLDTCAALSQQRTGVQLSWDAQGIITSCWVGSAPNCKDNCGSGFALRGWGFGSAPDVDASVPPDAG